MLDDDPTPVMVLRRPGRAREAWPDVQVEEGLEQQAPAHAPRGDMVWIPGGMFLMGSNRHHREEGPLREIYVDGFWMDPCCVTNLQFSRFVEETGYVTTAERALDPAGSAGPTPERLVPGSMLFVPGKLAMADLYDPRDCSPCWSYVAGTSWRCPEGPGSTLEGLERHPVVHVSYEDAQAYARWAGKELPTEAQWERAARGGLVSAEFCWGADLAPGGRLMANFWQGRFPFENVASDGYEGTSPVGAYPANGFGLHDMAGNVWQWTQSFDVERFALRDLQGKRCCVPQSRATWRDQGEPGSGFPKRVLKGGSYLCALEHSFRCRPAARLPLAADTSAPHVGFRCVFRPRPAR